MIYSSASLRGDGLSCSAAMNFWMIDLSSIPSRIFRTLMSVKHEILTLYQMRSQSSPVCIKCASVCR